jgi:hypothetical protein
VALTDIDHYDFMMSSASIGAVPMRPQPFEIKFTPYARHVLDKLKSNPLTVLVAAAAFGRINNFALGGRPGLQKSDERGDVLHLGKNSCGDAYVMRLPVRLRHEVLIVVPNPITEGCVVFVHDIVDREYSYEPCR